MRYNLAFVFSLILLFLLVNPAYASGGVSVDRRIEIFLANDRSARFTTILQINNTSNRVVAEVNVALNAANVSNLQIQQDANAVGGASLTGNMLKIPLPRNLLPGGGTSLSINYTINQAISESAGVLGFYLPDQSDISGAQTNTTWKLTTDSNVPNVSYFARGVNNLAGSLEWEGNSGNFFLFAENNQPLEIILDTNQDLDDEQDDGGANLTNSAANTQAINFGKVLVNLPYFDKTANIAVIAGASTENYYALSSGNYFETNTRAQTPTKLALQHRSAELSLSEFKFIAGRAVAWPSTIDSEENISQAYKRVLELLKPDGNLRSQRPPNAVANTGAAATATQDEDRTFTALEYSQLLSDYLNYAGIPSRVVYGYVLGFDKHPRWQFSAPTVWVEALQDGNVVVLNPFLEDLTRMQGRLLSSRLHVKFGVYNVDSGYDTALGLIGDVSIAGRPTIRIATDAASLQALNALNNASSQSNNFQSAPSAASTQSSENLQSETSDGSLFVKVNNPNTQGSEVRGWTTYRPELLVTNFGNSPLAITALTVDQINNISGVNFTRDLYPLVLPGQSVNLRPLVWAANLFGGESNHIGFLTVNSPTNTNLYQFEYQLPISINFAAVAAILVIFTVIILLWLTLLRRFNYLR